MLKFRRTKSSERSLAAAVDRPSSLPSGGRMKKSAPPPPPGGAKVTGHNDVPIPRQVAVMSHNPEDSAINELLEGRMELDVVLPGNKTIKMTVERRMPMMDLLVQVTSANKISPGGHMIHVVTERGNDIIHYKPNTPIGSLDTNVIHVVPKNAVIVPAIKKQPRAINQPFEQTFRLQVNLPRNQMMVLRVSPRTTLGEIHTSSCLDKALDPSKYDLRHPNRLDEPLDRSITLSEFGLNEITLISLNRHFTFPSSSSDMMAIRGKDDEKKKKGLFPFQWKRRSKPNINSSNVDPNSRGVSPTRSDSSSGGGYTSSDARSTSPQQPITFHEPVTVATRPPRHNHHKKRQAPSPPMAPGTSDAEKIPSPVPEKISSRHDAPIVSHSRHSSDSSGYHEASVLSEGLESMTHNGSATLDSSYRMSQMVSEPCPNLKSSISCPNVSTTGMKKRRAPLPPQAIHKEMEDIDVGLRSVAMERIVECKRLAEEEEEVFESSYSSSSSDRFESTSGEKSSTGGATVVHVSEHTSCTLTQSQTNVTSGVRTVRSSSFGDQSPKKSKLTRQSTINLPVIKDEDDWKILGEAYNSKIEQAIENFAKRHPPEKPIRKPRTNRSIIADPTNIPVTLEEDKSVSSRLSQSSDGTIGEIQASYDEVIAEAEKINNQLNGEMDDSPEEEFMETHKEEKQIFKEESTESECTKVVYRSEASILLSPRSGQDRLEKEVTLPSFTPTNTLSTDDNCQVLSSTPKSEVIETERRSHSSLSDYSSSSISSVTTEERSESKSAIIESDESYFKRYMSLPMNKTANKSLAQRTSKTAFSISPYTSRTDVSNEISALELNKTELIGRFSSMQNLWRPNRKEPESEDFRDDVENTMRKVQSEVNLMVSQQQQQRQDLQHAYKQLQEQMFDWQKELADHQITIIPKSPTKNDTIDSNSCPSEEVDQTTTTEEINSTDVTIELEANVVECSTPEELTVKKEAPQKTLATEPQKSNIVERSPSEEPAKKEEVLQKILATEPSMPNIVERSPSEEPQKTPASDPPMPDIKPQEPPPRVRSVRHKPSIKIGTWSDQQVNFKKQYKTEIKIRSDELEAANEVPVSKCSLVRHRPSFQISHSKKEKDIYSTTDGPIKPAVPKAATVKMTVTKSPVRKPEPVEVKTWNRPSQSTFRKRGVTTNNKGELVVTNDTRFDVQNKAILEAKNKVMEEVKSKVKEVAQSDRKMADVKSDEKCNNKNVVYESPPPSVDKKCVANKGLLIESNVQSPIGSRVPRDDTCKGPNEDCCKDGKENQQVPPVPSPPPVPNTYSPPPPPPQPTNVHVPTPIKRKPRKIIEPKLDPREELMLAIRNFGGRNALKKV